MTSRERVLKALNNQKTDRVPMGFSSTPEAINNLKEYLNVKNKEEVFEKLNIDIRRVAPRYIGPKNLIYNHDLDKEGKDIFGVVWRFKSNNYGKYPEIVYSPLANIEHVEQLEECQWPQLEWFDFNNVWKQIEKVNQKNEYCINFFGGNIFETSWYMRGFEQTLVDLIINPELVICLMEKICDFYISFSEEIVKHTRDKIDIVCTGDDIGTQRGLLISLDLFRKFIKPLHKKMNNIFHKHGLKVRYHSCGNITDAIEDLIEAGVDILNPLQFSASGMLTPLEIKKKFGKQLSFQGGIDIQHTLVEKSVKQVKNEVENILNILGENGGYILETTHNLQGDIPPENILSMYNTGASYKR